MSLPSTPEGWAIHLSRLVRAVHQAHGSPRFPIDVASIAKEFSRNVFPKNPITKIEGTALSSRFEGMLLPHPDKNGEWGIVYNSGIRSKGRINFTLAHELGHYLLHRLLAPEGIQCSVRDMHTWKTAYGQREAQANTFASFLLMPLDDFRTQIDGAPISLALMRDLSDRYAVSITAAILKWLSITSRRGMIVVSKDGFIDWSWSSEGLIRTGVFFRARQEITPVPPGSLAARSVPTETELDAVQPAGVWPGHESVHEFTMFAPRSDMVITLLLYPDVPSARFTDSDDDGLLATDEHFAVFGRR